MKRGTARATSCSRARSASPASASTRLPPHEIRERGLVHCPERRRPFRELTVLENLLAGAYLSRSTAERNAGWSAASSSSRVLAKRKEQVAGKLSGGEQQMLATARALMFEAKLLAIDEPSLGLAPNIRQELFAAIARIHADGHAGAAGRAGGGAGVPAGRPQLRAVAGPDHRRRHGGAADGRRDAARRLSRPLDRGSSARPGRVGRWRRRPQRGRRTAGSPRARRRCAACSAGTGSRSCRAPTGSGRAA